MKSLKSLSHMRPGDKGMVQTLLCQGRVRRRLQELGFVEDVVVECVGQSPMGDPRAFRVGGAVIALRDCHSAHILVM